MTSSGEVYQIADVQAEGYEARKLAAARRLTEIFADRTRPLKEGIQLFLDSDEVGHLEKIEDTQRVVRGWVMTALTRGTTDRRVQELANILEDLHLKWGSLGRWAFDVIEPAPEPPPAPPTIHDLEHYLERVLPTQITPRTEEEIKQAKADARTMQAIFEEVAERVKHPKDFQTRLEAHPRLTNYSPEEIAIQYTIFLLSLEKREPYHFDLWRVFTKRAEQRISLGEIQADRLEWKKLHDAPERTWDAKRTQIEFLLNAPSPTYLGSTLFEKDVHDFLTRPTTRLNRRQLPEVLDELEAKLRTELIKYADDQVEQRLIQRRLAALDTIRTLALLDFSRPSFPDGILSDKSE